MFLDGFSSCTCLYEWLSIFLWVFVMYMFVRMTIHFFWMGFRHVHFCTNNYQFLLDGFSSRTCLYEWLSISFEWVFVMYMFVRMTIQFLVYGLSSFTFLYGWLSISLNGFSSYICLYEWLPFLLNWFSSCTCLYEWLPFLFEWIVVIYISVRMTTISFCMDSLHLHFCTNDYYFFLNGLLSCTFLYELLPFLFEWIVLMHVSVRMTTISLYMGFRHAHSVQMTFNILWIWIFVMHISVRMTFHILLVFSMCAMLFNAWIARCSDDD